MSTTPFVPNKYLVRSIEEEISLFDRKLAHLHNFETFSSEEERIAATGRLSAKRDRLLRTLRNLTEPAPPISSQSTQKKMKKPAKAKTSTQSKSSHPAKAAITALSAAEPEHNAFE